MRPEAGSVGVRLAGRGVGDTVGAVAQLGVAVRGGIVEEPLVEREIGAGRQGGGGDVVAVGIHRHIAVGEIGILTGSV